MMKKTFSRLVQSRLALFTLLYLVIFLAIATSQRNTEFSFYASVLLGILFVIVVVAPRVRLEPWIVTLVSFFILLHLLAGNIVVSGQKLYDVALIGEHFRMDNLVHFVGSAIATFLAYNLLEPFIKPKARNNPLTFSFLVILIALGVGSVNEMLEFLGVLYFDAAKGVGGYINNAKDQMYNLAGAVVASGIIYVDRRFDADGKTILPRHKR